MFFDKISQPGVSRVRGYPVVHITGSLPAAGGEDYESHNILFKAISQPEKHVLVLQANLLF